MHKWVNFVLLKMSEYPTGSPQAIGWQEGVEPVQRPRASHRRVALPEM